MSKTKAKTSREIQHLIGENKRLRKQNSQLKRMLEKHDEGPRERPEPEPPEVHICQECGKGELDVFEIVGRIYTTCKICGDRKKLSGPV